MKMKMKFAVITLVMLLVGCHDTDNSTSPPIVINNALTTVEPFALELVDLLPYVESSHDPQFLKLSDIELRGAIVREGAESCDAVEKQGIGFELQIDGAICEYEYKLKDYNTGEWGTGTIIVVASNTDDVALPPIASPQITGEPTTISIGQELDYELSPEVILYGEGDVAVDINANEITYTGYSIGLDQIVYSLVDGVGNTKFGTIDITLNDTPSTGIIAEKDTEVRRGYTELDYHDIDTVHYVSADEQNYFIEKVISHSVSASIDPTNDKVINIDGLTPGEHYLTYLVSTDEGAFDVGQVKIIAIKPSLYNDQYIVETDDFYIATPPRAHETSKFSNVALGWRRCIPVNPWQLPGSSNYELLEEKACFIHETIEQDLTTFCNELNNVLPAPMNYWEMATDTDQTDKASREVVNSSWRKYVGASFEEEGELDTVFSVYQDVSLNPHGQHQMLNVAGLDLNDDYDYDDVIPYDPDMTNGVNFTVASASAGPEDNLSSYVGFIITQERLENGTQYIESFRIEHPSSTIKPLCIARKH